MSEKVGEIQARVATEALNDTSEFTPGDEASIQQVVDAKMNQPLTDRERNKMPSASEFDTQETIDFLIEHCGNQIYDYMGHKGTIIDIINLCPPAKSILKLGPDFVLNWIGPYKVMEQEEVIEDDTKVKKNSNTQGSEESVAQEVKKNEATNTNEKPVKKADKQVVAKKIDANIPVAVIIPAAVPVKESAAQKDPANEHVEAVSVLEEPSVHVVKNEAVSVDRVEPVEIEPAEIEKAIVETLVDNEADMTDTESVVSSDESFVDSAQDAVEIFPKDSIEPVSEETQVIEVPEKHFDIMDHYETWQELAETETPVDVFFVSVIEKLNTGDEDLLLGEILSMDDALEQDVYETSLPELQALLVEVRTVKTAIKKLYQSRSKEECETHVDDTVIALSELLRSFGYDNPEKLIRDFLYAHPLMSLSELLDELERSLELSIRRETYVQKQATHRKRHSSFGRLVLSVLQALSLRAPLLDTSS